MNVKELISNLHAEESGQDLLEYALVLAAVVAVIVTGSSSIAAVIGNAMGTLSGKIKSTVS